MRSCALTWTLMLIGVIFFLGAPDTNAEDVALGENGFTRLNVSKTYVDLPSEKAVITILRQPYGKTENRFWGESVEVAGGIRLPGLDTTPADNTRCEVALNYLAADAKNSETSSLPLGFYAIDGFGDANGTLGVTNAAVLDTSYKTWGIDLKVAKDMKASGIEFLTLSAGLTYSNTVLTNDFNLIEDGIPIPVYLKDDIDTDYYGIMVGADVAIPLSQQLFLDFGGRLELLYADAQMTAQQDLDYVFLDVDDSEDKIAGRVGAHLGLSYDLNPVVFGVGASANYLSYQPYAEHPTTVADSLTPSHIEDDHMFSYTFNISMNVAF
jgi:hypothetical protein